MNENGDNEAGRMERLEAAQAELRARLDRIERKVGLTAQAQMPSAPPPLQAYTQKPVESPPNKPVGPPQFDYSTRPPAPEREDAELKFGSVVLPRVGAGVALLGIGYLVALSIQRGWITPWMQFWGAVVLCVLSIGIGLGKRQEKFDFGQVMVGLGSCGLYVTFAAGHAFQNLYPGETLVALYLALSLVNLAYGAFTPSKTFTSIGILGGLAASLLPMREHHVAVSLGLHAAIILPAAAVVAYHKWRGMAIGAWLVSTLALIWPILERGPVIAQLSVLYSASVILLLAYVWSHEGWNFDPKAVFIPFAALITGSLGFVVGNIGLGHTTWHLVIFGAVLAASTLFFKREDARNALLLGGILAPFVFAPLALRTLGDAWTYLALAAISLAASVKVFPKAGQNLGALGLTLGLIMYGSRLSAPSNLIGLAEETALLLSAIALLVFGAWRVSVSQPLKENSVFVASLLASPLISRLAAVLMGQPGIEASVPVSILTATLGMAAAGAIVAMRQKWMLMTAFSWLALIASGFAYIVSTYDRGFTYPVELTILTSMLAVILLSEGALGKTSGTANSAGILGGFAGWGVFTRLIVLVATHADFGMTVSASVTAAWIIYAAALIAVGFMLNLKSLRLTSLAVFGMTLGKVLLYDLAELDPAIRVVLLILLGTAMIAGGYWYIRRMGPTGKPPAVAA